MTTHKTRSSRQFPDLVRFDAREATFSGWFFAVMLTTAAADASTPFSRVRDFAIRAVQRRRFLHEELVQRPIWPAVAHLDVWWQGPIELVEC